MASYSFDAIGTHWTIDAEINQKDTVAIATIIDAYDAQFSRFRKDSQVTVLATSGGTQVFMDGADLFAFYSKLIEVTDNAVTPLIGDMLVSLGYDADYSLQPSAEIAKTPKRDILQIDKNTITLSEPHMLDFGAAGKGHLVDIVRTYIKLQTTTPFSVDAGGDMFVYGSQKVGLENPFNTDEVIGFAEVSNQAICGSATNRRAWGDYNHIVDPRTSHSVKDVIATWVIADSCMVADGLATALFFVQPEVLEQSYHFEYIMLMNDGAARMSNSFPGELYS